MEKTKKKFTKGHSINMPNCTQKKKKKNARQKLSHEEKKHRGIKIKSRRDKKTGIRSRGYAQC